MFRNQMTIRLRMLFVERELQQDVGECFIEVKMGQPSSSVDRPKTR
ncbi:hypothetical protein [Rhodopirellula bahusiensis]|nr:hypothetical protein [Rhodopirellula bahusiensis]